MERCMYTMEPGSLMIMFRPHKTTRLASLIRGKSVHEI